MRHIISIKAEANLGTEHMANELKNRMEQLSDNFEISVCTRENTIVIKSEEVK